MGNLRESNRFAPDLYTTTECDAPNSRVQGNSVRSAVIVLNAFASASEQRRLYWGCNRATGQIEQEVGGNRRMNLRSGR
jgi:hypothetical protein